jgi:hypothetical protein
MIGKSVRALFGALLTFSIWSAFAAEVIITGAGTTASCTYQSVAFDPTGKMSVTCSGSVTCTGTACGSSTKTPQAISFVSAPGSIAVNGIGAVTATSTSNLAVLLSSKTTSVCTILGNTVSGTSEGTCTIAGNQPGDSSYAAAPEATKTIAIVAAGSSACLGVPAPQYSQSINFTGGMIDNVLYLAKDPAAHTTGAFQFNAGAKSGVGGFSFETNVIQQGTFNGKTVALSACPGDFSGIGVTQGSLKKCDQLNTSPLGGISLAVGSADPRYCTLAPGGTYYLNVQSQKVGESITFNLIISPPP